MFGILDSLAGFIKIRYVADKPIIDSTIARLHYRVTAVVLFVGCLLCTANSLIGNPIECIHSDERMQKVLNQYCWISSTFTLPAAQGQVGVHMAHAGVGAYAYNGRYAPHPGVRAPHVSGATGEERYHAYYQWVPFVLFFQVGDFFLLHLLGQNINMVVYTEFLEELSIKLGGYAPNAPNSATIERQPIYPTKQSLLPE
ncbi:Innexin [Gryllus bimaculatus]|nr:Innexin [Gryllus bimaculatus]